MFARVDASEVNCELDSTSLFLTSHGGWTNLKRTTSGRHPFSMQACSVEQTTTKQGAECPIGLPFPGRRSRRAWTISIAITLILLSTSTPILQYALGGIVNGANTSPSLSADDRTFPGLNTLPSTGPGISLPPGTVDYGIHDTPFASQLSSSSFPPHLTITNQSYDYQTSSGQYSFSKTTPYIFSLRSKHGQPLTTGSMFTPVPTNSAYNATLGLGNVTTATNNRYEVTSQVLIGSTLVGYVTLITVFSSQSRPKLSISFAKTDAWTFGDFNIVWSTIPVQRFLSTSQNSTLVDVDSPTA